MSLPLGRMICHVGELGGWHKRRGQGEGCSRGRIIPSCIPSPWGNLMILCLGLFGDKGRGGGGTDAICEPSSCVVTGVSIVRENVY